MAVVVAMGLCSFAAQVHPGHAHFKRGCGGAIVRCGQPRDRGIAMRPSQSCVAYVPILLGFVVAAPASAQSIEPRAYSPAPVGANFAILGWSESKGAIPVDPALPLSDIDLKIEGVAAAYVRSINLFGKSAKFDLIVPVAHLKGLATYFGDPVERDIRG
ncbi:hypothetical protein G7076_00085 [Sphingomonas sp. HDW15A]|uniref:hypothetical protein n=1 Tax=Sphingomonas sp. HDW15A TaxID=2714942 RepID=UPI00140A24D8|nr:hypothetical protein [Sphingomonas sp. HDW15A]QIK95098.1 hypothetical protein G7076_00085 [Sphingomonas sp. HDW15A]